MTRWGTPDERWILNRMPRDPRRPWPLRWLQLAAATLAIISVTIALAVVL